MSFVLKLLEGKLQRTTTDKKSDVTIGTFHVTNGNGYLTTGNGYFCQHLVDPGFDTGITGSKGEMHIGICLFWNRGEVFIENGYKQGSDII